MWQRNALIQCRRLTARQTLQKGLPGERKQPLQPDNLHQIMKESHHFPLIPRLVAYCSRLPYRLLVATSV